MIASAVRFGFWVFDMDGNWFRASHFSVYDKHSFVTMSMNFLGTPISANVFDLLS
jgi:hypothetical protein